MPQKVLLRQIYRYAVTGAGLTVVYSSIYWSLATHVGIAPLIANTVAFCMALILGYLMHSRWSFQEHGKRDLASRAKFVAVNLLGYALNSFWIWLILERLRGTVNLSLLPIIFVTPWISFWLNRRWTFA